MDIDNFFGQLGQHFYLVAFVVNPFLIALAISAWIILFGTCPKLFYYWDNRLATTGAIIIAFGMSIIFGLSGAIVLFNAAIISKGLGMNYFLLFLLAPMVGTTIAYNFAFRVITGEKLFG